MVNNFCPFHDSTDFRVVREDERVSGDVRGEEGERRSVHEKLSREDVHRLEIFRQLHEEFFVRRVFPTEEVRPLVQIPEEDEIFHDVDCHRVQGRVVERHREELFPVPRVHDELRADGDDEVSLQTAQPCTPSSRPAPRSLPCHLVPSSVICHTTSKSSIRPRHGVSSPPGIAVPTASIDCNAPVRVLRSCTFDALRVRPGR